MTVSDATVAALRAYLAGDEAEYQRLYEHLDRATIRTEYLTLLTAAFTTAVDRRFGEHATVADVTDFVGYVRSRSEQHAERIDPNVAERMILGVLGLGSTGDLDGATMAGTGNVLLAALIGAEGLDDAELDAFIADARKLANDWTSRA